MKNEKYEYQYELSPEEFLDSPDVVIEKAETPEIKEGSFIYIRSISAEDSGKIMEGGARFKEKTGRGKTDPFMRDYNVTFVLLGACHQDGSRLFNDINVVNKLKQRNSGMIMRLASRIQKLSGFSKEDLEQLEKNSLQTQEEDSPSD